MKFNHWRRHIMSGKLHSVWCTQGEGKEETMVFTHCRIRKGYKTKEMCRQTHMLSPEMQIDPDMCKTCVRLHFMEIDKASGETLHNKGELK